MIAHNNAKIKSSSDNPVILSRSEHIISRSKIDENTLKVLYRLHRHGHKAYLVGGSVRDMLLGRAPKDFDIGTDATPQQIKKLFRNSFLVGKRFRLAHIRFGPDQVIEVATFRRLPLPEEIPTDTKEKINFVQNQFGSPKEDAFRRDFTVNALFYNIADFSVIDFVDGLRDLSQQRLRVIGDPKVRFQEDPVRMLRALEFSHRLNFSLEAETVQNISELAPLIAQASEARIRDEVLELFRLGIGAEVLNKSSQLGLLEPMTGGYRAGKNTFVFLKKLNNYFKEKSRVDEHLIIAALHMDHFFNACPARDSRPMDEVMQAANHVITPFCAHFRLANGLRHQAREVIFGCYRLYRGLGHRGQKRFLHHPQTLQILEFFRLWVDTSEGDKQLYMRWEKAFHERHNSKKPSLRKKRRHPGKRARQNRGT